MLHASELPEDCRFISDSLYHKLWVVGQVTVCFLATVYSSNALLVEGRHCLQQCFSTRVPPPVNKNLKK